MLKTVLVINSVFVEHIIVFIFPYFTNLFIYTMGKMFSRQNYVKYPTVVKRIYSNFNIKMSILIVLNILFLSNF